jgi:hypothetical protein
MKSPHSHSVDGRFSVRMTSLSGVKSNGGNTEHAIWIHTGLQCRPDRRSPVNGERNSMILNGEAEDLFRRIRRKRIRGSVALKTAWPLV